MFPRFRRSLRALVFNPDVNLALTEMNLVDHLANNINDLDDPAQIAKLVPYRMLDRLVRDKLQTYLAPWNQYQFRVCAISPGCGIDFETDTLLISPMLDRP